MAALNGIFFLQHMYPENTTIRHVITLPACLAINMLAGSMLLWRLIARHDQHRIRLSSACLVVAMITAIAFGIATSIQR